MKTPALTLVLVLGIQSPPNHSHKYTPSLTLTHPHTHTPHGRTKPDRTSVYSTLVGLINAATYDTGKEVVLQLSSRLQACLEECDFTLARSLVRFIADLGNASGGCCPSNHLPT
jgi:hypothetical protein